MFDGCNQIYLNMPEKESWEGEGGWQDGLGGCEQIGNIAHELNSKCENTGLAQVQSAIPACNVQY